MFPCSLLVAALLRNLTHAVAFPAPLARSRSAWERCIAVRPIRVCRGQTAAEKWSVAGIQNRERYVRERDDAAADFVAKSPPAMLERRCHHRSVSESAVLEMRLVWLLPMLSVLVVRAVVEEVQSGRLQLQSQRASEADPAHDGLVADRPAAAKLLVSALAESARTDFSSSIGDRRDSAQFRPSIR